MKGSTRVLFVFCYLIINLIKVTGINTRAPEKIEKKSLNSFFHYNLLLSQQIKYCTLIFLRASTVISHSELVFTRDENFKSLIAESYRDFYNILHPIETQEKSEHNKSVTAKVNARLTPVTSTKQLSSNCFVSVIFIRTAQLQIDEDSNDNEKLTKELKAFFTVLTTPVEFPLTKAHEDFYVFLTNGEKLLEKTLRNVHVAFKFKYKLGISIEPKSNNLIVKALCLYCNNGQPKLIHVQSNKNNNNIATNLRNIEYFANFLKNFNGKTIRASLVTIGDGNQVEFVNGIGVRVINSGGGFIRSFLSAAELLNFTYVLLNGGGTGLKYQNGTYDGVVGDVLKHKADVGVCVGVTLDRFFIVDVCSALLYFRLSFVYGPTHRIYDWKSIFWPFSLSMWICVGVSSLMAWNLLELFDRTENRLLSHGGKNKGKNLKRNNFVLYITASIFQQNTENLNAKSTRIFSVWWLFFMLIISTAYLSKLYGFFASPKFEKAPNDFRQVADAKDYKIYFTFYGGAIFHFFQSAKKSSFYYTIFKRMKKTDPSTCHKRVLEEKAVCITYVAVTEAEVIASFGDRFGHSAITQAHAIAFEIPVSLTLKRHSILGPSLSSATSGQFESGIINKWGDWKNSDRREDRIEEELKEKAGKNNTTPSTERSSETLPLLTNKPSRLDLLQIQGAIALYVLGLIIATMITAIEIIIKQASWLHIVYSAS